MLLDLKDRMRNKGNTWRNEFFITLEHLTMLDWSQVLGALAKWGYPLFIYLFIFLISKKDFIYKRDAKKATQSIQYLYGSFNKTKKTKIAQHHKPT